MFEMSRFKKLSVKRPFQDAFRRLGVHWHGLKEQWSRSGKTSFELMKEKLSILLKDMPKYF